MYCILNKEISRVDTLAVSVFYGIIYSKGGLLYKILLIDDEQVSVALLKHGLTVCGYDVQVANDGMEGFVLAQDGKPDLIICDIMMPNLDGVSFVRQCRKTEYLKRIPIFVLSANEGCQNKLEGERIEAFFMKPFVIKDILNKVEEVLN